MISGIVKDVKVVLKLAEGSQTIPGCNQAATDEQLYALGSAVGLLELKDVEAINKVEETMLISE